MHIHRCVLNDWFSSKFINTQHKIVSVAVRWESQHWMREKESLINEYKNDGANFFQTQHSDTWVPLRVSEIHFAVCLPISFSKHNTANVEGFKKRQNGKIRFLQEFWTAIFQLWKYEIKLLWRKKCQMKSFVMKIFLMSFSWPLYKRW